MNIYDKRLLNVAKALRESQNPEEFSMGGYFNSCGTPQCALGHYASRRDLQKAFKFSQTTDFCSSWIASARNSCTVDYNNITVLNHFHISDEESEELFSNAGCDFAETNKQAARYIERFVKNRTKAKAKK